MCICQAHGHFIVPHAHDNAGQIRILFPPAAAAMKFDFLNKPVLSNGGAEYPSSGSFALLFVVAHLLLY